jgi:hypothetical protein
MNATRRKQRGVRIPPWVWGAVGLYGVVPEAVAADFGAAVPSVWAAAAALSLTLITAVRGPQK